MPEEKTSEWTLFNSELNTETATYRSVFFYDYQRVFFITFLIFNKNANRVYVFYVRHASFSQKCWQWKKNNSKLMPAH